MDFNDKLLIHQLAYTDKTSLMPQLALNSEAFVGTNKSAPADTDVEDTNTLVVEGMSPDKEDHIYRLDEDTKVGFEDLFPGLAEFEQLAQFRSFLSITYHYVLLGFYGFLTLTAGVFLSIAWALVFATVKFVNIWALAPARKVFFWAIRSVSPISRLAIRSFIDPIFESIGLARSAIAGRIQLSVSGINKEPAAKEEHV